MILYRVYDNGKLATYQSHRVDPGFRHPICETFEQAQEYARKWLGKYSTLVPTKTNESVDYSGYGDIIEIRAEEWKCQS